MSTIDNFCILPDARLGKRAESIKSLISEKSSVVMNRSDKWSDQIGFYRFFSNDRVREEDLISCIIDNCVDHCRDLNHLLLIEDTTEFNLESHRHRITDTWGLGLTGNNKNLGFFCHPSLVINPLDASLIGVADFHLWHREEEEQRKPKRKLSKLPIEEKESYRWSERAKLARKQLNSAKDVTVIQDREGDIFESFYLLNESRLEFVIRSNYDRKIVDGKLRKFINDIPIVGEYEIFIEGNNKKRLKRKAIMEMRHCEVQICRPANIANLEDYPENITVRVVQVREKPESVPDGEKPVEWTLYTSHQIENENDVLKIVYWYTLRWIIEDMFRTVKSEGLNYEETELETGKALRKLLVMAFWTAIHILQLRQARDGHTLQKPTLIFSEAELECMQDLMVRFEGKTEKLKNPHPRDNLAWASWLIARLGGWKGYTTQRPAGVITLRMGLQRFHDIFEGWVAAKNVYKR